MSFEHIELEYIYDGQVLRLRFKEPPANVITAAMMKEISSVLKGLSSQKDLKALVLSGEGKNFSFGASVEEHTREQVGGMLPVFHKLIGALLRVPVPTLALVNGYCLGGGLEVAMACDVIFADEKAKFGVPEIQLGVFPPVAAALAPYKLGQFAAHSLIMSGETFSAEFLQSAGMLQKISPLGESEEILGQYIEKYVLPRSASSLQIATKAVRSNMLKHYEESIVNLENLYLKELMATYDANEGIKAFIEKRKPIWQNA